LVSKLAKGKRPHHRFAYRGLDRVIHERARLGVLTSLHAHKKGLVFANLKQLCGLTDGNLSRHLLVLEQASLIEISKRVWLGRSQTICRITPAGRRRFLAYLGVLQQVLHDASGRSPGEVPAHEPSLAGSRAR
jgi:hypothetical protein